MYELKEIQKKRYFQKNLNISITFEERKIYGLFGKDPLKKDLAKIMALHTVQFSGNYMRNGEEIRTDKKMAREVYYQTAIPTKYHRQKLKHYLSDKKLLSESYDHLFINRMLKKYSLDPEEKIRSYDEDQKSVLHYLLAMAVRADLVLIDDFLIQDEDLRNQVYEDLIKRHRLFQSTLILLKDRLDEDFYDAYLVMKDGKIIFNAQKKDIMAKAFVVNTDHSDHYFDHKNILQTIILQDKKQQMIFDRWTDDDLKYIEDHRCEMIPMDLETLLRQMEEY